VRLPTKDQVRYHGERWAWVPGLALLAFLLFPSSSIDVAPLLEAKVADRDMLAPFTFSVNKSDQELAREAEELASTVKPIYEFQQRALDSATSAMHVFFARIDAAAGQGAQSVATSRPRWPTCSTTRWRSGSRAPACSRWSSRPT